MLAQDILAITEEIIVMQCHRAARVLLVASAAAVLVCIVWIWAGESAGKRWPAGKPPTEAENRAVAESARPVLDAIYSFKSRNGLWPSELDELVPEYVANERVAGWSYNTRQNGYWKLINYAGYPHTAVQFRYLKDQGGQWELSWGEGQSALDVPYTSPAKEALPVEEVNRNLLATMGKRIERYPGQIIHHKGLVTLLLNRESYAEAHEACRRCLERWP